MGIALLDVLISLLQVAMTLGILVLAVLLFWHLRRIGKSVLAFIFWCVMLMTALTPLMQFIQSGMNFEQITPWFIFIMLMTPAVIIGCYFINPLKPIKYQFEEDDDDDGPFEVPDEV